MNPWMLLANLGGPAPNQSLFDPASPGGPHTASTLIELGPNESWRI